MKKLIFAVCCVFVSVCCSFGQTVRYTYKPLAAEGCDVQYSVSKQSNSYFIIVTVQSDRMKFLTDATMTLKTFNNNVVTLKGTLLDTRVGSTAGVVVGNMVYPVTSIHSTAQFEITEEQFEYFNEGIAKIRLSTIPIEHERSFRKDKIGNRLYKSYQAAKDSEFSF